MTKKNSQVVMLPHSKAKVSLYREYLEKYLRIITLAGYKKVYLYDLFCGVGRYENGGKGSPLVTLDVVQNLYTGLPNASINIEILFNDANSAKIDNLKNIIDTEYPSSKQTCSINYSKQKYNQVISGVKNKILTFGGGEKCLLFIDPYGYKDIKVNDLKAFLQGEKVELLLFLPTSNIYRYSNTDTKKLNSGTQTTKAFLEDLFGDPVPQFNSNLDFVDQMKNTLRKSIKDTYVDTFTLESTDKKNLYCLFFFSKHIYGYEKILESKWKLDTKNGQGFKIDANESQTLLFSPKDRLKVKLKKYLIEKARYNGEIYQFTLEEGFLPTDAVAFLKCWKKQNKLVMIDTETKGRVSGNTYGIAHEYWKKEEDRKKIRYEYIPQLFDNQ